MGKFDKSSSVIAKKLAGIGELIQAKRFGEAWSQLEKLPSTFGVETASEEAAYFHYLKGYVFWELGDKKGGIAATQKALEMYLVLRDLDGIAKSQKLAGALLIDLGNLTLAKEHLELAVSTFKPSKQWGQAARALNQMAYLSKIRGELRYANDYNAEAQRCASLAKDKYYETVLRGSLSWHQFLEGDWKAAKASLKEFLLETNRTNDWGNYALGLVNFGRSELLGGRFKEARKHYLEASQVCSQENLIGTLKIVDEHLAELSIAEGRFSEAEDYLKKALEIGERVSPYGTIMTQCWRLMGDLYNAKGEPSEALKAYETCESYLIKLPEELERGACFVGRGVAYANLKNWKDAKNAFDRAFEVFENCENDWELSKAVVTAVECGAYASKQMETELLMGCEFFQKYEHPAWDKRARKLLGSLESAHDRLPLDAKKGNLEKQEIITALQETGNNVTLAAKKLGLLRSTLHYKIKRYKI
ncbi:MAG TPA: tetratricopeptide repeat protein, partial [Verrucomicrobiae bacterium]|nr:tetratricopeptide repeat protein [Verrucomicrobiae bacterium]